MKINLILSIMLVIQVLALSLTTTSKVSQDDLVVRRLFPHVKLDSELSGQGLQRRLDTLKLRVEESDMTKESEDVILRRFDNDLADAANFLCNTSVDDADPEDLEDSEARDRLLFLRDLPVLRVFLALLSLPR